MYIMSVDVGTARTGVALSDKGEGFAFPKCVITEYNREKLLLKLTEKAKELGAEMIVVGYPTFSLVEPFTAAFSSGRQILFVSDLPPISISRS